MASHTPVNRSSSPKSAHRSDLAWLQHYPSGIDWHRTYDAKPLYSILDDAADNHGKSICTNFLGKTITYDEICNHVAHAAAGLQKRGVAPGVKVGLFLPNCPTYIVYYFAILKLGAIVVNYNPLYSHEELEFQVKNSGTRVMVTLDLEVLFDKVETLLKEDVLQEAVICSFPALLSGGKSLLFQIFKGGDLSNPYKSEFKDKLVLERDLIANDGVFTQPAINPYEDIAVLQYSGGTTGVPKGAMLTHANLYVNVHQIIDWAPDLTKSSQRVFAILPFFHVFGMTVVMNFSIATASEIVLVPRFDLDNALKLVHTTKPTMMPGVPTLFNAITNHPKLQSFDLSSLVFCISGGAALPLEVKQKFERLTGAKLIEGYGLSETSPVVAVSPIGGPVKENCIGQPLPQTILSLRDLNNPEKEVPIGEKGEVCIAGPQVMKGYWNAADATKDIFIGEFLRTGDVAVMDNEGFFFIVDRIKDLIISSGYNVFPRRIEDVLYEHPEVEEAAVIGVKDEYRGEVPKAFVKLCKDAKVDEEGLMAFMAPKLSKIEMPVEIEVRDELPKTPVGKPAKKVLKAEEDDKKNTHKADTLGEDSV